MRKLTFTLLACLCALLLAGCGEYKTFYPAAAPGHDGGTASLSSALDGEGPENDGAQDGDEPGWEKIPRVMLGGELYCDTGVVSDGPRCGTMDGEISSSVESWQRPAGEGQSNFGAGYGCQTAPGGTIEINIDGHWHVFQLRSEMRVHYFDDWFDAADVSDETLRWLMWFNSLSEEDQLCISYTPLDLYELRSYPGMGEITAVDAES